MTDLTALAATIDEAFERRADVLRVDIGKPQRRLRIEAGRRAWGAELGPDETPFDAGLTASIRLDKAADFIGRDYDEAERRAKAEGRGTHRFFEPGMDAM